VNLDRHTRRPGVDVEHRERQGSGEQYCAGDPSLRCHVLRHTPAVGEADDDESVGQLADPVERTLHQHRIPDRLRVSGGLLVVVEHAAVVLVDGGD